MVCGRDGRGYGWLGGGRGWLRVGVVRGRGGYKWVTVDTRWQEVVSMPSI